MKNSLLILFLGWSGLVSAQLDDFSQALPYANSCNPFYELVANFVEDSWNPTHGAVELFGTVPSAIFEAGNVFGIPSSDGLFIDYDFESGVMYELVIDYYILDGYPSIQARMANGLSRQFWEVCEMESLPFSQGEQDFGVLTLGSFDPDFLQTTVVSITADSDYEQFWLFSDPYAEGTIEIEYVGIEIIEPEISCAPPQPQMTINGSSATYHNVCYGDSFTFGGSAITDGDGCDYDGFLIEVGEYADGEYQGSIVDHYYGPGVTIPTNLDLYEFIQVYGNGWWDFEGGKSYRVKLATWRNDEDGNGIAASWREVAQYTNFTPASASIEFLTQDNINTEWSVQGYSADVADICSNNIFLDLSGGDCFDRYTVTVQEFDVENWENIGNSHSTGPIFDTEAPAFFNLNSVFSDYEWGQTYRVTISTAFPYTSETLFFKRLYVGNPTLEGEFVKVRSEEQIPGPGGNFTLHTICPTNGRYLFDALATTCEDRHRIQIEEFSLQSWTTVNNPNNYDSQWNYESLPNQFSLNNLFGSFQVGHVYRLTVSVGTPLSQEKFLFQISDNATACIKPAGDDPRRLQGANNGASVLSLYPNPSSDGLVSLQLGSTISGIADVSVFRSDGSLVFKRTIENPQATLDLSREAPGLYFIEVHQQEQVQTLKLIKSSR